MAVAVHWVTATAKLSDKRNCRLMNEWMHGTQTLVEVRGFTSVDGSVLRSAR